MHEAERYVSRMRQASDNRRSAPRAGTGGSHGAAEPGKGFRSLIPLAEILGELLHCGPRTRKPQLKLAELALRFGSELDLLMETPLPEVSAYWPELGEALRRMRAGEVIRRGGYDGEYGVIRLFEPGEMEPSLLERVPRARRRPLPSGQGDLLGGLAAMQEKKENGAAGLPAFRQQRCRNCCGSLLAPRVFRGAGTGAEGRAGTSPACSGSGRTWRGKNPHACRTGAASAGAWRSGVGHGGRDLYPAGGRPSCANV